MTTMTTMTTRLGLMQEPKDFPPYGIIGDRVSYSQDAEDGLICVLPVGTEAVVDYQVITVMLPSIHSGIVTEHYAIGTALILKKTQTKKEEIS